MESGFFLLFCKCLEIVLVRNCFELELLEKLTKVHVAEEADDWTEDAFASSLKKHVEGGDGWKSHR